METVRDYVAANVKRVREARNLTVRALSQRLGDLGHPLLPSGITKIEQGERGVDAVDLVALAVALRVNPNALLLPDRAGDDPVALTSSTHVPGWAAWSWADGRQPLPTQPAEGDEPYYTTEEFIDFQGHARPLDLRARDHHTAVRAAQDVLDRLHRMLMRPGHTAQAQLVRSALDRLIAEIHDLAKVDDGER